MPNIQLVFGTALGQADVRQRLARLGGYLAREIGLAVTWNGYMARVSGSYLLAKINGVIDFSVPHRVMVLAEDPGVLFRGVAEDFLKQKFGMYLNPAMPLQQLPA